MTEMYRSSAGPRQPVVNAGKLWAGGLATALITALIAVVGILIGRGLFDVQVLAPKGDGVWGDASTFWYAMSAAGASLLATALVHVLIMFAPEPMRFFGWVITLATIGAMAAPFATDMENGSRIYTALLNLILGIAIGSLVAGSARAAIRPVAPVRAYP